MMDVNANWDPLQVQAELDKLVIAERTCRRALGEILSEANEFTGYFT